MLIYVKSTRFKHTLSLDMLIRSVNLRDHRIIWTSTRRPVFVVSDYARLKQTYSVTEISWNAGILSVASLQLYFARSK